MPLDAADFSYMLQSYARLGILLMMSFERLFVSPTSRSCTPDWFSFYRGLSRDRKSLNLTTLGVSNKFPMVQKHSFELATVKTKRDNRQLRGLRCI
jgi:hypothetical protein